MTTAFAKVGLSGDYGGTWFLTQLVGTAKARELYFLSDVLDAARIEALGLANRVVADEELVAETMALAEKLANGPSVALRYMKRNLNAAESGDLAAGLDSEAYGMLRCPCQRGPQGGGAGVRGEASAGIQGPLTYFAVQILPMSNSRWSRPHACCQSPSVVDVVIVGAGFAGLYMLHRLRGLGLSARVFEAGSGVGGTWYWNRYPGARCDVESMQYSYSFSPELQQEWEWSERFAAQPEILRYANHVADRFDLRRDIQFDTRGDRGALRRGDASLGRPHRPRRRVSARYCVMATGCLSTARMPDFPGLERFAGKTYHTGHWPHEGVDFTGKRVGVIGTGSSAIQAIPVIAAAGGAAHRVPAHAELQHPGAQRPADARLRAVVKADYPALREKARHMRTGILEQSERRVRAARSPTRSGERIYEERWAAGGTNFMAAFNDLIINRQANDTAAEFVRDKIREIVHDPAVAELLAPKNHPIGTKRICVDTDYYETYNRDNVTLVDVRATPITEITANGLRAGDVEYEFDSIVFATGFDAMTGALLKIDIRGATARRCGEKWAAGPRTYLGLMTAGFPNLFMITGPGSPSVLSNMMVSIEQHVDWIADCLAYLRAHGLDCIEATQAAEDAWVAHGNEVAQQDALPAGELLVHGRQHPRQAAGVHAVYRRRRRATGRTATRSPRKATRLRVERADRSNSCGIATPDPVSARSAATEQTSIEVRTDDGDCFASLATTALRLVVDEPVDLAIVEQPSPVLLHHVIRVAAG